jgi:hypothetical protein
MQEKILSTIGVGILALISCVGIIVFAFLLVRNTPRLQSSSGTVSLVGETVCLPHKNKTGVHTLECAIGLQTSSGDFYGLANSSPSLYETNRMVSVRGVLGQDTNNTYDTKGVITVESWNYLR